MEGKNEPITDDIATETWADVRRTIVNSRWRVYRFSHAIYLLVRKPDIELCAMQMIS